MPDMEFSMPASLLIPLLCGSIGCGDAEPASQSAGTPAAERPAKPLSADQNRDIETYEKAVGDSHGLSKEQVLGLAQLMRETPVFKNRFLGVSTLQSPSDAWMMMEIMYDVKPDLIIEAGTFHGGSANLWAIILEHINPDGRVITIDIEDQRESAAKQAPIAKRKVDFLLGSSTDPKIVEEVYRLAEGKKRVLVMLDSLHSKEHVAAEIEAYAPLVNVGSYIVVQDTMVGPKAAIDEFLAGTDTFVADRKRERYADTGSVRGYLQRVKR